MIHIAITLCSECHEVPITTQPKIGTAKMWEKLLICDACATKWIERQQAKAQVPTPSSP